MTEDLGGYQAYCCRGFRASTIAGTESLVLVGQNGVTKRGLQAQSSPSGNMSIGLIAMPLAKAKPVCVAADALNGISKNLFMTFFVYYSYIFLGKATRFIPVAGQFVSLFTGAAGAGASIACKATKVSGAVHQAAGAYSGARKGGINRKQQLRKGAADKKKNTRKKKKEEKDEKDGGPWSKRKHDKNAKDCAVTYTCRYGLGFDEICDNQRWAIDRSWGGKTVYHSSKRGNDNLYDKHLWHTRQRAQAMYTHAVGKAGNGHRNRCEVDEFPMGALAEGRVRGRQLGRLVNGKANGLQGKYFHD
jgi:chitinase